ncbi:MAG: hypothetical protein JSR73_16590 [Proteobacteria bacterium]|nr:hypothetical protein [Pseudomonadota bacterium]
MTDPSAPPAVRARRRLQFIALALVFFGPLALAFYLYYGGVNPAGRVNRGTLVTPPRPLPEVVLAAPDGEVGPGALRGKWSLVTFTGAHCESTCARTLDELKRARLALERDGSRVRRVLLGERGCCAPAETGGLDPDLVVAWRDGAAGEQLATAFAGLSETGEPAGRVYIVDPRGNLMMTYAPGTDLKNLMKDLEKLLRLSHIG